MVSIKYMFIVLAADDDGEHISFLEFVALCSVIEVVICLQLMQVICLSHH
jgi:hypothetical protein